MGFEIGTYERTHDINLTPAYAKIMRAEFDAEKLRLSTETWVYTSKWKADERLEARKQPKRDENGDPVNIAAGTVACEQDDFKLDEEDLDKIRKVLYTIYKKYVDLEASDMTDVLEKETTKTQPKETT